MDLVVAQLLSAVALLILSIIFTIAIPVYLLTPSRRQRRRSRYASLPALEVSENGFSQRDSVGYDNHHYEGDDDDDVNLISTDVESSPGCCKVGGVGRGFLPM